MSGTTHITTDAETRESPASELLPRPDSLVRRETPPVAQAGEPEPEVPQERETPVPVPEVPASRLAVERSETIARIYTAAAQLDGAQSPDAIVDLAASALNGAAGPALAAQVRAVEKRVLEAETSVPRHEAGGPGSTVRARNAARKNASEAERLSDLSTLESERIDAEDKWSKKGKDYEKAQVEARLVADKQKLLAAEPDERSHLTEREAVLLPTLARPKAEETEPARLARRVETNSVLLAAGLLQAAGPLGGERLLDLTVDAIHQGSPLAGDMLHICALAIRDPLRLKLLAARAEAEIRPRAVRALVADKQRLHAAVEIGLLRRMRHRLGEVRRLVARNEFAMARKLLERDLA